jgi:hypothetical protein
MSLLTYDEARPWAKAIREAVISRKMPPFHAAGPMDRFEDDLRMRDDEIGTIVAWVDQGAPRGDPADLPSPLEWSDETWPMGEPDLVVTMPRVDVRTDGVDDTLIVYGDHVFEEAIWVAGLDVRPSNRPALHHANIFLTHPNEAVPQGLISREMTAPPLGNPFLVQWVPGVEMKRFPDRQGMEIPAGSRFLIHAHYGPTTEAVSDETKIALYLANGTIDVARQSLWLPLVASKTERISPGETDYRKTLINKFESDALITDFRIHMHYRGKSGVLTLTTPDGELLEGLNVPQYDFNWQRVYYLREPLRVPAGTTVELDLAWDNSEANPLNPDPTVPVKFGQKTTDEMGSGAIGYTIPDVKLDPPIIVRDGRRIE